MPCLVLVVDRDLLVILDSHVMVRTHGLDGLDEVCGHFRSKSHEKVVFVNDDAALYKSDESQVPYHVLLAAANSPLP